ncbi:PBP1A family penicillin-binding protein [bacterium]|nr:PBP1A family penicillin-binding protein [bacterium]
MGSFKRRWYRRYWRWREKIKGRFWLYLTGGAFLLVVVSFLFVTAIFAWYSKDLPSPDQLVRREGFATRIYDRNGKILYDVYKEAKRTPVSWEQVPDYLRWATIAIEDKHFYSHPGFSFRGIARALYNIVVRHRLQGGSTLTQQLIKVVLLSPERTLSRKIKEFVLAIQTERKYTKDQILLMYLNEAPYGGLAWGVGAAAEQYFGKPVSELNLVECAILAGLPQRPSYYSPFGSHPTAYIARTKAVLRRMREDGYISPQQEKEAIDQLSQIKFAENKTAFSAPHFVAYVKKILTEKYGEEVVEQGGLRVTTTLDLDLQKKAEEIVKKEIEKVKKYRITNGAAVVMDPQTGEILAMVGSKDYFAEDIPGKFNVVTQGLRQPGSAIKPITYALALEKGYTAATLLMDVKTVFPQGPGQKDYVPVNYDGKYHGPLQVRYALGNSINVTAVKMLAMVGIKSMLEKAYEMGVSTLAPTKENLKRFGLSVTLGGGEVRLLELAGAYNAFANGGYRQDPVAILKVEDRNGKVLEVFHPRRGKRVLSPGVAFIISDILSDNNARLIAFGPHNSLVIPGYKVAVKTGTTNDRRDNWTIGWTPSVLVGVWVGNNDNSPMKYLASGISGAAPIWRRIIMEALKNRPKKDFVVPPNVVRAEVDAVSGYRAHDGFPSRMEYFIKGTEPTGEDPIHVKLKVCPGQNKLATPAQIKRGEYEEKEFFLFKEEDPVSQDGKNRWQEAILAWMSEQPDPRYHPPHEYCDDQGLIGVSFVSPENQQTVGNQFLVKIKVVAVKDVSQVKLWVNGEEKATFTEKPYEKKLELADGVYTLKAKAWDKDGSTDEEEIKIGVNLPWDWQPSPTPTVTPTPSPTPLPATPTPTPSLSPSPTPSD